MSILGVFDCAYYINLDRRPDRRKHMETVLPQMGIEAERFPAVEYKEKLLSPWGIWIDPCRLAIYSCLVSHLTILEKALERKASSVLILEDDIVPANGWDSYRPFLEQLNDTDWSLFWFYNDHSPSGSKWVPEITPEGLLNRLSCPPWWTHAYAVNGNYIKDLIRIIKQPNRTGIYPIDAEYVYHCKNKVYSPSIDLIVQSGEIKSDIR